jgi:pyridoxal phosphate enzyme (YggS family)
MTRALLTDFYQLTMLAAYHEQGMMDTAVFEFFVRKRPPHRNFFVAAGLESTLDFLARFAFTAEEIDWLAGLGKFKPAFLDWLGKLRFTGTVEAMPEGTPFFADEPILRVIAPLPEAQIVETRLINLLQFETLIASKAARVRLAAGEDPREQIREILQLGVGDLGESRVQVLTQRAAQINEFFQRQQGRSDMVLPPRLRWHMIGHLQRNKVKYVLGIVDLIHSVDSLRLAEELDAQAGKHGRKVPVLLQVNASGESTKFGVAVGAAIHLAEQITTMKNLQLVGLMTMAPLTADASVARQTFARTREIFEEMRWQKIGGTAFRHLSMGMSNDFEQAILEGATMVRIGTALFGGKWHDGDLSEEPADLDSQLRRRPPGAA